MMEMINLPLSFLRQQESIKHATQPIYLLLMLTGNDIMNSNYYYVYILASKSYGTLYIGVTNDLVRRVWEHKNDFVEGFTKKYGVHRLVYYEQCEDVESAITREKQMKKWERRWKLELIEKMNPGWKDLYDDIIR